MTDYESISIQGKEMKTYIFTISFEPDGDGWRAFHAPLEHMGASTWGKTREDALKNINEVLTMIVEEFLGEGRPIPSRDGLSITEGTAVAITR